MSDPVWGKNPLAPPIRITLPELDPSQGGTWGNNVAHTPNPLPAATGATWNQMLSGNYTRDPNYSNSRFGTLNPAAGVNSVQSVNNPTGVGGGMLGYVGQVANAMGGISAIGSGRPNPVAPPRGNTPAAPPVSPLLALSHARIDSVLGDGWSDTFASQHGGQDPITFFSKNFSHLAGNPDAQGGAAIDYAIKYGKFIPNAIDEWSKVHGNVPPPPEMWQHWDSMIQQGGQPQYGGAGINPYGVY